MNDAKIIKEIAKYYDFRAENADSVKAAGQWGDEKNIPLICEEISKKINLSKNHKVLEVGCGSGVLGKWIMKNCLNYTGLDISNSMLKTFLKECRDNKPDIISAGADTIPIQDNFFEVVIINGVAMYFMNNEFFIRVLKEIERVSKPNSIIFIGENATPSRYYWEFLWFQNLNWFSQILAKPYIKFRKWLATKNSRLAGKWKNTYSPISEKFLSEYFKNKGKMVMTDSAAFMVRKRIFGNNVRGNKRVDFVIEFEK